MRLNERFIYEYNFTDDWQCELRLEKFLPIDPKKTYPLYLGDKRAASPEDCGGPEIFMELLDRYPWGIEEEFIGLLKDYKRKDII